jgi:hypothetical protein
MSTTPYGENDPLTTTTPVDPVDAPTPIADGLIGETGLDAPTGGTSAPSGGGSGSSSGVDAAKEKASDALGSAGEHGSHVAETAKDEAMKVATEAKEKATDLLGDLRTQVDEQSKTQLKGLAAKLGELADEIQDMVSGSQQGGTASGVAQQLADKTHQLSSRLDSREPMDLLEDVRGFARRRPAAFLAGAAVAGVLAGRLTRGAKASQSDDTSSGGATTGIPVGMGTVPTTTTAGDPPSFGVTPTPVDPLGGELADDVPLGQNTGGRQ